MTKARQTVIRDTQDTWRQVVKPLTGLTISSESDRNTAHATLL